MSESIEYLTVGLHRGKNIADVPSGYLEWLVEQDWFNKGGGNYEQECLAVEKELAYREKNNAHFN